MTIYESEIPGVGRKFEVDLDDGGRIVVVVHHDGRREVFRRPGPEADSEKLFDLDTARAGELATVLQGSTFETVDVSALSVPLGEAIIEWTDVADDSPIAGLTLGDAHIRRETGVSVIAIQRGEETIPNPAPGETVEPGDILVTLGTREEQAALGELVA